MDKLRDVCGLTTIRKQIGPLRIFVEDGVG